MKNLKILSLIMALSLAGVIVAGCSKKTVTPTTTTQEITVGKGNIIVSITSTGSMDYANYQNLSFATDGNVGAVNVKVGDIVKKDQVLATLDPTAWNNSLTNLTQAVQTAQRNLTTVQSNLAKAQRAVATAQLTVSRDTLTAQKDQNTLQKDQDALANIADVKTAQDAVDTAQANLDAAQAQLLIAGAQGDTAAADFLFKVINGDTSTGTTGLKAALAQAQKNLKSIANGTSTTVTNDVALQVATAQLQISTDQMQILLDQNTAIADQAEVDDANTAVTNAQQDVTNAQTTLTTAQTNLTTAQAASTQITAPFDGAITTVNIQAGVGLSVSSSGAIKAGATAIVIADTSKFVANMMINETDLPNISVGTLATVTASAIPNQTLSAVVKTVSPIATVQSGVVNYAVTATILGPVPATRPPTGTTGIPSAPSGTTTPAITGRTDTTATTTTTPAGTTTTASASGRTRTFPDAGTGQTGTLSPDQIAQFQQAQAARQQSNASAMSLLRQGMSLTVNLIEQQAQNVIIVPNNAIKTVSGKYYVQLKTSSGTPQQQEVTIGLKDYSNTQIVSGLNVGDVIIITRTSSTATTTTTAGGLFGGGGGGGGGGRIIP